MKASNLFALTVAVFSPTCVFAEVITGPFVPGSGYYRVVSNGGFEDGLDGWSVEGGWMGGFARASSVVYSGNSSAVAIPTDLSGVAGFALRRFGISVTPGVQYVLSGFVNTSQLPAGDASLDLNDASFETQTRARTGIPQWQFVYSIFTPDTSLIAVREVVENCTVAESAAYFDDIAITPLAEFVAPTPQATALSIRLSQVELCWTSVSNATYQVQYRSELTTNLWTNLGDPVQGSGSRVCVYHDIVAGQPQRFYRLVTLP